MRATQKEMRHPPPTRRRDFSPALDLTAVATATLVAFAPALHNGFVNWDDPAVIVENGQLSWPGVVPWAFRTTLIGHYQPLAWLSWGALKAGFGLVPHAYHAASLAGHILNAGLVYWIARRLGDLHLSRAESRGAALVAACLFALNPASVEAVAWASALPYVLSLAWLLAAILAYTARRPLLSLGCYAVSSLIRATAIGFPMVLLLLDVYPLERYRRTRARTLLVEKIPFVVVAVAAAAAEWRARDVATLQEVGIGARLTLAATAPLVYLGRTLMPVHLSPLSAIAIAPALYVARLSLAIAALIAITFVVWRLRRGAPGLMVAWLAWLVLLAPVVGITQSGLQATADRYMYVPAVVVALAAGVAAVQLARRMAAPTIPVLGAAGLAIAAALGALTWQQTQYWSDSIALWTRAADLDPTNDVATYNLATALAAADREDEAMRAYEATLRLVPDHDFARRNLSILQAKRSEREGDRLAAEGRLAEAAAEYEKAVALDGKRLHARAARGTILLHEGRLRAAIDDLRAAVDGGVKDASVANGLAFALIQTGNAADAAHVLGRAAEEHPDDINAKHNLARLLATSPDPGVRDGPRALRLASEVCDRTGNRDPRALDTLAAAYAAVGRFDMARETASRAAARAREAGDAATADEIIAHARGYGR